MSSSSSPVAAFRSRIVDRVVPPTDKKVFIRLVGTLDVDGKGTDHPLDEVDPFILLDVSKMRQDHMPPFGAHPHRGHSVVTILMKGQMQCWDSFHHETPVTLTGPSSYWVDAGSGVFHEEHSVIEDDTDENQHIELFQLWVGVKEEDRKKPPKVQYDQNLPRIDLKDGTETVGTGIQFVGPSTQIETPHPISVLLVQQQKGTTYRHNIPSEHGAFMVAIKGKPSVGGGDTTTTTINEKYSVLVLKNDKGGGDSCDHVEIKTSAEEDAEYLICSGEKHNEKWYKKLVANGAVIAATPDEARSFVEPVESMSKTGKGQEGGNFAPFGIAVTQTN